MQNAGTSAAVGVFVLAAALAAGGQTNAQSLGDYTVVRESSGAFPSLAKGVTAECPVDTQVLSGGYRIFGFPAAGIRLLAHRPLGDGGGWRTELEQDALTDWDLEVVAICGVVPDRVQVRASGLEIGATSAFLSVFCPDGRTVLGGGAELITDTLGGPVGLVAWGALGPGDHSTSAALADVSETFELVGHAICGTVPNRVTVVDTQGGEDDPKHVEADCPPGLRVVGGSVSLSSTSSLDTAVLEAGPGVGEDDWQAFAAGSIPSDPSWSLGTRVVCAPEPDRILLGLAALAALSRRRAKTARGAAGTLASATDGRSSRAPERASSGVPGARLRRPVAAARAGGVRPAARAAAPP